MRIGLTEILALAGLAGGIWFFKLNEPLSQPAKDFLSWKSNQYLVDNAKRLGEFSQKRLEEINGCEATDSASQSTQAGAPVNQSTQPPPNALGDDNLQVKLMKQKGQRSGTLNVARATQPQTGKPSPKPTASATPATPQPGVNCRNKVATTETPAPVQTPGQSQTQPYTGSGARPAPPIDPKRKDDATINRFAYPEDKPYRTTPLEPKADQDWMATGCQSQSVRGGNRLTYQEYEDHLASRRNGQRSPLANTNSPALFCLSLDGQKLKYIPDWGDGTQSDLNRLSLWVSITGGEDEIDKPTLTRSL